ILMGFRCTGKSSAGRRLAQRLRLPFYDTDALVERQSGRTIPQIVAEQGWQAFREAECAVIGGLAQGEPCVIALGGGAVLDARNVECLGQDSFFVWLFAAPEAIAARMEQDATGGARRPALTDDTSVGEIERIMAKREPTYRRLADLAVDTTRIGTEIVVEEILGGLPEQMRRNDKTMQGREA
ncbi:MAG: shikimate kinase, partial [Thermodesulfobacteriota bacterium]